MPRFLAHSTVPFLSTPSARRATRKSMHRVRRWIFLSTPSARRATEPTAADLHRVYISIHALREEGDALPFGSHLRILFISIHALREEGDTDDSDNTKNKAISIHALREEGDVSVTPYNGSMFTFLSTPSARRATRLLHVGTTFPAISIHALREEGDGSGAMRGGIRLYFYPRPPRGGRPSDGQASTRTLQFLSTPSARRATTSFLSIFVKMVYFYPRPPRGGRLVFLFSDAVGLYISIHALREEGDWRLRSPNYNNNNKFLSTPSARRATFRKDLYFRSAGQISIHALREEGDPGQ